MQKSLPLLATHLCICIAQDEPNGSEEVALAGAIAPHDHVVFRRKGFNDCLLLVAGINIVSADAMAVSIVGGWHLLNP